MSFRSCVDGLFSTRRIGRASVLFQTIANAFLAAAARQDDPPSGVRRRCRRDGRELLATRQRRRDRGRFGRELRGRDRRRARGRSRQDDGKRRSRRRNAMSRNRRRDFRQGRPTPSAARYENGGGSRHHQPSAKSPFASPCAPIAEDRGDCPSGEVGRGSLCTPGLRVAGIH